MSPKCQTDLVNGCLFVTLIPSLRLQMIISTLHIQYVNQYTVSITPDYKHLCSTPDYQVPINLSVIHT